MVKILQDFDSMAYQILTRHFCPVIKIGGPLDPIFGKIFSGNISEHQEGSLGIILSPISGFYDQ